MRIGHIAFVCTILTFSTSSVQAEEAAFKTEIECGGVHSKIVSVCPKTKVPNCSSQSWQIGRHEINLKKLHRDDFNVVDWACLPSKLGNKIIFWSVNWGNCDTCERLTVWNPQGQLIVGSDGFGHAYKDMGFPPYSGAVFHEQFSKVIISAKDLNGIAR